MDKISENIRNKINNIPALPGIYKMLDLNGRIIYIGKSICLKNRVKSYFTGTHKWSKVEKMVKLIQDVEYEVTDTHLEARLEECRLIKELKPIFNSQMKNDRSYVYLKVEDYNIHNSLTVVYQRKENSFGPFRRKFTLQEMTNSLKNIYPITKSDYGYEFSYNLFPITMDKDTFNSNKECLIEIFSDDEKLMKFINAMDFKMNEAASLLQFETAITYRNMISTLNYLKGGINSYKSLFIKSILLKIETQKGYKLFYVNKGEILLKKNYTKLTSNDIKKFIEKGKCLISTNTTLYNEKKSMDFRTILYSEIKSLPEDMVVLLD